MSKFDPIGPAPDAHSPRFVLLLLGVSAAPLFWLGQVMLDYGVTAHACYPGDHPQAIASAAALGLALMIFNGVAVIAALAGGAASWWVWRHRPQGSSHFLALWGMLSSLCFFCAILFNLIAALMVPPCLN